MVSTNSWNWTYPDGEGGTISEGGGGGETYPDIAQPGGFPWRYAQTYKFEPFGYGDQDPLGQWWWTNSWSWNVSDSTRTRIDLHTGGATNSTAQSIFVLNVSAYDAETSEAVDPTVIQVRGEYADTNGVVALTLNDNGIYDITPTLPAAFSNYYFYVSDPAALRPRIFMDFDDDLIELQLGQMEYFDGTNVTTVTSHVMRIGGPRIFTNGPNDVTFEIVTRTIGEKVTYRIEGMNNYPNATYRWSIPASAVSQFIPTLSSPSPDQYETNHVTTNSQVTFYCTAPQTETQLIQCEITAGPTTIVRKTYLRVIMPNINFTARVADSVRVSTGYRGVSGSSGSEGYQYLHFGVGGDTGGPGMKYEYRLNSKNVIPREFDLKILQIGESRTYQNFSDSTLITRINSGLDYRDTGPWYHEFGQVYSGFDGDAPGESLQSAALRTSVQRTDKFKTYLLFKPGGPSADSIHVPIKMIEWKWMGAATNAQPGNATWQLMSIPSTNAPIVTRQNATVPFSQFPRWVKPIQAGTYTTNSTPKPLPDLTDY